MSGSRGCNEFMFDVEGDKRLSLWDGINTWMLPPKIKDDEIQSDKGLEYVVDFRFGESDLCFPHC